MSVVPPLGQGVHLWLARDQLVRVREEALVPLLDEADRVRLGRFTHVAARRNFLVGRALVRTALSHYASVAATTWRFGVEPYGRPEIAAPAAHAPGGADVLRFNLSHAKDLLVCAVTRRVDVGVDVECVQRRNQTTKIAHRFFAPAEVAGLNALPQWQQRGRFFDLWTLKESYIKARGLGLAIPLGSFSFDLETEGRVALEIAGEPSSTATEWQFALADPTPEHRLALCVRRPVGLQLPMQAFELTELDIVEAVDVRLRARSV